jgi:hypothetical protein
VPPFAAFPTDRGTATLPRISLGGVGGAFMGEQRPAIKSDLPWPIKAEEQPKMPVV